MIGYMYIHTYIHTHCTDHRKPSRMDDLRNKDGGPEQQKIRKVDGGFIKEFNEDDLVASEEEETVVSELCKRMVYVRNLPKAIQSDEVQVCVLVSFCVCSHRSLCMGW